MDGLCQLTASAHTIAIGGRTFRLTPLTLADYGEIENRILAGRPDPLEGLPARLAGLPPPERQAEWAAHWIRPSPRGASARPTSTNGGRPPKASAIASGSWPARTSPG